MSTRRILRGVAKALKAHGVKVVFDTSRSGHVDAVSTGPDGRTYKSNISCTPKVIDYAIKNAAKEILAALGVERG